MISNPLDIPPAPDGSKKMDAPTLRENYSNCDHSTMGSTVIPQTVSGYKNPPGGKSPTLAKPARMRNR